MKRESQRYIAAVGAIGWSLVFLCLLACTSEAEVWFGEPIISESDQPLGFGILADLNHDGRTDLVASNWQYQPWHYKIFHGDGLGRFNHVQDVESSIHLVVNMGFALIDENADGHLDLIGVGGTPMKMWHNDGTGHFVSGPNLGYPSPPLKVADIDGDGHDDLAGVYGNPNAMRLIYGTPNGLDWGNPQTFDFFIPSSEIDVAVYGTGIIDLDGDTRMDAVVCGWAEDYQVGYGVSAVVAWRYGLGNRQFSEPHHYYLGGPPDSFFSFDAADIDLDGDQDLACQGSWYTIVLLLYDAEQQTFEWVENQFGSSPASVDFAQLDQDEYPDAVQVRIGEVYQNNGDGTFIHIQDIPGTWRGFLGQAVGNEGPDLVTFGYFEGIIGVWYNLAYDPAGAPPLGPTSSTLLTANPSIASEFVQLVRPASTAETGVIHVLDIQGRVVRTLAIDGPAAVWNLKSDRGDDVDSGVYWLRLAEENTQPATRVTVIR